MTLKKIIIIAGGAKLLTEGDVLSDTRVMSLIMSLHK